MSILVQLSVYQDRIQILAYHCFNRAEEVVDGLAGRTVGKRFLHTAAQKNADPHGKFLREDSRFERGSPQLYFLGNYLMFFVLQSEPLAQVCGHVL